MFRAQHAIVSLLACSAIAVISAGCEDEQKATPQVIFEGFIQTAPGKDCRDNGSFTVGEFGNPAASKPSVAVADQGAAGQGNATVGCSVTPSGTDEFAVDATVVLSGATGGLFTVKGKFKTTGEQTGINVITSVRSSANTYNQNDGGCIVRYTEQNMGVAAGRVWGSIDCPNAVNASDDNRACRIVAQFRFENCGQ